MRAVMLTAPDRVEVRNDHPEPECGPDDVLIAVWGVGLCGSDLAVVSGRRAVPALPWVIGHEAVGDVVAVGDAITDRHVGQRIVVEPNFPCLECESCRIGVTAGCARRRSLGINVPGVLAERIAVPARFTWPVDVDQDPLDALCVEPLAVALTAVDRVGAEPGRRCLVIGAGAQGQLVSLALRARGAIPVVTDINIERAKLAVELGAELFARNDERFAVVIETSGAPSTFAEAVSRTAHGGRIALIGQSESPSSVRTFDLVQRRLTVYGCLVYDHPHGFAATLELLRAGDVRPGRLLRRRYSLGDSAVAFRAAGTSTGKSWISIAGDA